MLAYIVGNSNFNNFDVGKNNAKDDSKMGQLQVRIKEKIDKVKNFDPDICYDFSEVDDLTESYTAGASVSAYSNKSIDCELKTTKKTNNKSNTIGKKIQKLKFSIKLLDITASIFIILGCIISQIENENYYYDNKCDRVEIIKLITNLNKIKGDINRLNFSNYNISYINNESYIKEINFTNYQSIPIPFEISSFCHILRLCLTILTIGAIPLIVLGRYTEYLREYIYKQNLQISFVRTLFFKITIYEILLVIPFQYPKMNSYVIIHELGGFLCLPFSSMLSSITFIRLYFVLKLFKHLTKWTSFMAENICEKNLCKADTKFAFKAFQKENPFFILLVIFIFTCLSFGLSLRIFELYYWESRGSTESKYQDWEYYLNCMWCIFVSMTTVGYGDFYPKTSFGRFITIIACMVGTYFVSMMMVFMTQKSGLSENQKYAYNLITRLKLRNEIKAKRASMILYALRMSSHKLKKNSNEITEKEFQINYSYEKRKVTTLIEIIKNKEKIIHTFENPSLKEKLIDISERIDADIKEIKNETDSIKYLNEILVNFSESQMAIAKYLKKNCYATKMLYNNIENKPIFGKLNNVDKSLKNIFENTTTDHIKQNINESENNYLDDENFEDNIFNYDVGIDEVKDYFNFLLSIYQTKKYINTVTKSTKQLDYFKRRKSVNINSNKLKEIHKRMKTKLTARNLIELKSPEKKRDSFTKLDIKLGTEKNQISPRKPLQK